MDLFALYSLRTTVRLVSLLPVGVYIVGWYKDFCLPGIQFPRQSAYELGIPFACNMPGNCEGRVDCKQLLFCTSFDTACSVQRTCCLRKADHLSSHGAAACPECIAVDCRHKVADAQLWTSRHGVP